MKLHAIYEPGDGSSVIFIRIEGKAGDWFAGISIGLGDKFAGRGKTMEEACGALTRELEKAARKTRKPAARKARRKKKR